MDLDGLATAIRQTSSDPVALKLSELLSKWKDDESNVKELESAVERYIGNTWIISTTEHEKIYRLWSQFRDDAVHGIGGMTMNERLYCFSLFPRFDGATIDQERKAIYAKLLANP
jgi:hypothetical protein